jgi:hypothetical protein
MVRDNAKGIGKTLRIEKITSEFSADGSDF